MTVSPVCRQGGWGLEKSGDLASEHRVSTEQGQGLIPARLQNLRSQHTASLHIMEITLPEFHLQGPAQLLGTYGTPGLSLSPFLLKSWRHRGSSTWLESPSCWQASPAESRGYLCPWGGVGGLSYMGGQPPQRPLGCSPFLGRKCLAILPPEKSQQALLPHGDGDASKCFSPPAPLQVHEPRLVLVVLTSSEAFVLILPPPTPPPALLLHPLPGAPDLSKMLANQMM